MVPNELPIDLLFALILAAAAGWFAHHLWRRPAGNTQSQRTEPFNHAYFAGLNHLLNEQPDQALEVLRGLAEADANTVETQLALGHLYRRRGEVDKAIRVHDSVMRRSDLSDLLKDQAAFALGEDYLRAGLLDRAEDCFLRLADVPAHRSHALRHLQGIYEQQRDWQQAVLIFERLAALTSPEHPTALAHYYCELAEAAGQSGDQTQAVALLEKAFSVQRNFPRGSLLSADQALANGDAQRAALLCKRALELHPHLLPIALPKYVTAIHALNRQVDGNGDADNEQLSLQVTQPAQRAALGYAAIVANVYSEPFLLRCIPDFLRHDANLGDLVQALAGEPGQMSDDQLKNVGASLLKILRRTQRFRCLSCGVNTGSHFWQCPGCHSWDTLAPVSRLELAPNTRR